MQIGYLRNIFQLHALQARVQQNTSLVIRCVHSSPAAHLDAFSGGGRGLGRVRLRADLRFDRVRLLICCQC